MVLRLGPFGTLATERPDGPPFLWCSENTLDTESFRILVDDLGCSAPFASGRAVVRSCLCPSCLRLGNHPWHDVAGLSQP